MVYQMLSLRMHCNLKAALAEWLGHRLLPLKSRDQLFTDFTFYANDPMGTHHVLFSISRIHAQPRSEGEATVPTRDLDT